MTESELAEIEARCAVDPICQRIALRLIAQDLPRLLAAYREAREKAAAFDNLEWLLRQGYSIDHDYAGFMLCAGEHEFSGKTLQEQAAKAVAALNADDEGDDQ